VTESVQRALDRLLGHAESGELADVCRSHGIVLMVVFGSAIRPGADAADLDIAVRFDEDARRDVLGVLDDLYRLVGSENVDLIVLNDAGSVARERALVGGRPLYQARAGRFATEQIAAVMERLDTDHLRRLDLELMAQ
jgi:predicted nucleotidyltransferase